jgi:hypothetical protein
VSPSNSEQPLYGPEGEPVPFRQVDWPHYAGIPSGAIRLGSGHHILRTSDGNYIWKDPNCKAYNLVDVTSGDYHTLVSEKPLHIEASLLCPQGCGAHGFIREGKWVAA